MILLASSTGTDGTPAARGSGVGSFRSFRFHKERKSGVLYTYYFIPYTFYLDKKHTC